MTAVLQPLLPEDAEVVDVFSALTVTERARIMRVLEQGEDDAIRDKSYQDTPTGQEVKRFLDALRFEGRPQNTLDTYELPLAKMSLKCGGWAPIDFCSADGVAFLRDLLTRFWGESALETRRTRLAAIRSFFAWEVLERGLPWNPAAKIKPPRQQDTQRVAHKRTEMVRLLNEQETLRDRCALSLMLRLGLRKNDLRMLRIRDIDLARDLVWLRHRKGGGELMLPIEYQELREDLYLHIQGERRLPHEFLLYPRRDTGRPMDPATVHRWFKRCLERADLPDFPLHELRHTAGDEMHRRTGSIVMAQQLLGHKSLETTRRYLHPTDEDLRAAMRAVAASYTEED